MKQKLMVVYLILIHMALAYSWGVLMTLPAGQDTINSYYIEPRGAR